ncbi:MAG: insulinase family protein [Gammaproteobacteria bacterium]|nr:insulinase family protein [Gammaproteobacteria bacterium]
MSVPGKLATALTLFCCSMTVLGQTVTLPDFKRVELDNGAVLLLLEKHDVPLIGVEAIVRGGAVSDPEGLSGLSSLLARLLEKGAGERDSAAFAEAVAAVGGQLVAAGDLEALTISGEFMSRDAALMVELLADMLRRPALDAEEMNKLRDRSINFIRAAKDSNLRALLPIYGAAFLFGDHAYGNPVSGSEESLARIRHDDLLRHYADHVGADRLIVTVAGDFDTAEMVALLTAALSGWRQAEAEPPFVVPPPTQLGRRVLLVDKPGAAQTYFWLGNTGVAAGFAARAELDIANTLFGGRFTSMLNRALRVESGLTYGAHSVFVQPSQPGSFAIYSFTNTASTIEAVDRALGVLEQLLATVLDAESLQSAKNYILGHFPPELETARKLAAIVSFLEHMDLGRAYVDDYAAAIAAADTDSVLGVISAVYPAPENLVFVLLGDAEIIREDVAKYGPVTEIAITEPRFRP